MSGQPDGTVGKALEVLDLVASFGRPVRFSDVQDRCNFPKATVYRIIRTLTRQGMLSFDEDRQLYSLGVRLVRLAHSAWAQSSLAPLARPHLDSLSAAIGETVHLAQLDNAQVIYVDKRNAAEPIEMFSEAGKVGPAYCTGVGKVMLAFLGERAMSEALSQQSFHRFTETTHGSADSLRDELADIRALGFGFDREEHEPGIICVAVPIRTRTGRVLGGISVTSSTERTSLNKLEGWVPSLLDTADRIAAAFEAWRFPDDPASAEAAE